MIVANATRTKERSGAEDTDVKDSEWMVEQVRYTSVA
jgi:hypothetical protein